MTREFDKQRRDDSRPSFRKPSSGRNGEERTPRPARPRLNRETVDRAWESGAQQQHADYRPRSNSNWRSNQQSEYSSQNGRSGGRPYGNRQDGNQDSSRRFERTPNGGQGSRSQSFDANRRNYGDQRAGDSRG